MENVRKLPMLRLCARVRTAEKHLMETCLFQVLEWQEIQGKSVKMYL